MPKRMTVCIIETIDSAHHLPGHEKCHRPHGHTYTVEVVLRGALKKGMVMEFGEARQKIRKVLEKYDHVMLNDLIKFPTCENICTAIHKDLKKFIPSVFSVKVWEGKGKWAEVS